MRVAKGGKWVWILPVAGLLVAAIAASVFIFRGSGPAPGSPSQADSAAGGSVELASTGSGGDGKENGEKKTPIPVSVAGIGTGKVSSYISSTANLVSENEVKVLAETEGRVAELLVEEGARVARGQVLAALAREDEEITFNKAQLKSSNAKLAHERAVKALAEDLLSRESYDKVTMDNDLAQQELAEAKWRLDKTVIRAPFDGHVTAREIRVGQHIRPGDHVFTVADFDPLIARIYLPEKEILGLSEGRDVRITLKADESMKFGGRIRQISPVVDTGTGTVKVTVEATAPPSAVRPGAFVTIDVVRETHPRALLVPREAVIRELQDSYVFVANGEVAQKRSVSLGLEEGGVIEALAGLSAGDKVIVAGQGGLKDSSPIKIIPSSEASDLRAQSAGPTRG
ncbi:MAG TPA: efflux RND transporter periplasmic adaptor subunit [Candidatus Polarisedimenticolia bacterium]|jgi:membrane fusion protein (multidrug efflux system)